MLVLMLIGAGANDKNKINGFPNLLGTAVLMKGAISKQANSTETCQLLEAVARWMICDVRKLTITIVNKNTKATKATIGFEKSIRSTVGMEKVFINLENIQKKVTNFLFRNICTYLVSLANRERMSAFPFGVLCPD